MLYERYRERLTIAATIIFIYVVAIVSILLKQYESAIPIAILLFLPLIIVALYRGRLYGLLTGILSSALYFALFRSYYLIFPLPYYILFFTSQFVIYSLVGYSLGYIGENAQYKYEKIIKAGFIDPITELYNTRYSVELLREQLYLFDRYEQPSSIFIIDLPKNIFSDKAGPAILKETFQIGQLVKNSTRLADKIGYLGNYQFILIAPRTPIDRAPAINDRIQNNIFKYLKSKDYRVELNEINLKSSFIPEDEEKVEDLIAQLSESISEKKTS